MKDRTVLIIAHRLSTIRKAKIIFLLSGGNIEETLFREIDTRMGLL